MSFIRLAKQAYSQPKSLGKIAVVFGGPTAEREVSLDSGTSCFQALLHANAEVEAIEISTWKDCLTQLLKQPYDCILNLVHGTGGEDGRLQSIFELLNYPYVGSGVLACATAMNKVLCKKLWGKALNVPQATLINADNPMLNYDEIPDYPVIVKPNNGGSSNGISIVNHESELTPAIKLAQQFSKHALIEQYIQGTEVTVSILGNTPMTPIEIIPENKIYDYHAKYISDNTIFHCPPKSIKQPLLEQLKSQALLAFNLIGGNNWGRADFMLDNKGTAWILEVNLIPGMTSHSLVPKAAKQADLSYAELVCGLIAWQQQSP